MPEGRLRYCAHPGCPEKVPSGRCLRHRRQREQDRGSRHARGYDSAWTRLRDWFMAQPENQLCRACDVEGVVTVATDADHIVPFDGLDDPLRLDPANLQPSCERHNASRVRRGGAVA